MAIEAVIWVSAGCSPPRRSRPSGAMSAERGLPADFIRRVNSTDPDVNAWARFERSEMAARPEFDALFLEEATPTRWVMAVRGAEVLPLLYGDLRPRVLAAMLACKARFKVGCITNNVTTGHGAGMASSAEKAAAVGEIMSHFAVVIESSKAGVRKPDPRIYLMMCEALGVAPEACVYLDDLGVNCKPAAALGMTAIKVTTEDQLLADLAKATGLAF
ncbi:HAD-IA family hydrolase [Caulobacter sp. B11]|uniref:HAD-IA family hydrolase n=1 Tax=Caulobacter sp. B11 TaxID=2048899 RepID=UPI001F0227C1|nr:HAD-IA family hydrolase [Caulobacter sp. B11]